MTLREEIGGLKFLESPERQPCSTNFTGTKRARPGPSARMRPAARETPPLDPQPVGVTDSPRGRPLPSEGWPRWARRLSGESSAVDLMP